MEKFLQLNTNLSTPHILAIVAIALLFYVCSCYVAAVVKKRADLADIAWGFGFVLVAWLSYGLGQSSTTGFLVNLLVTIWALRLSLHIYQRNQIREEDFRYKNMKNKWGKGINLQMFFQVFLLQGFILYIIALPIFWIHTHPQEISPTLFWGAISLWVIGFLVETISDWQLVKFKEDPLSKEKLCMRGLWSRSRHPNYLGELCQWWAIWIFAATLPNGWELLISPLLLSFLLIKVSGIAPLENKMQKNPDFLSYASATPPLIPISTANSLFYSLAQYISIYFGAHHSLYIPMAAFGANMLAQMVLFRRWDRLSYTISMPLAIYALGIGFLQESIFTHTGVLVYPNETLLPPLWLIYIYPMFSLTLNNSFSILNKNLVLAFFVGGFGSIFSYISGAQLGGVLLATPLAYPVIFFFWGISLTFLIALNRQLIWLYNRYTTNKEVITVFFDKHCSICEREMRTLKQRKQTGLINYTFANSETELKKITTAFSYKESMDKIHALDANETVITGIDALSAIYARTDLLFLAIILQAPFFRPFFSCVYALWAKLRPKSIR
jgi:steroid 5-alpha reductase family enzyme/predicted DCC family thiol-disulfide oxidoreductase YuxK